MSDNAHYFAWAKFGGNPGRSLDGLNPPASRSFDFAKGPVTEEQLFEWVNPPDYECPDCAQFDYQQVRRLIGDCLATAEKVNRLALPKVFWRLLADNLDKAENLWSFTLDGYMGWTRQGLAEDPLQRESVSTTAAQLHILFSTWYSMHGDCLNGTGEVIWDEVLSQIKFSQGKLDRIRASFKEFEQPFFLWEVDYIFPEKSAFTITIKSPEIAAWFVLFSLHKVFRLFCLLAADVLRGPSEGDDVELSHSLFEYWADIQAAMAVSHYWYDRIHSLNEALDEFEKRVCSDAHRMTREQLRKRDAPRLSVGRVNLFEWFKNPSSREAGYSQWQSFWMAKTGQLEPSNDTECDHEEVRLAIAELRDSYQTAVMKLTFDKAVADFRKKHRYEKNLLLILDGKQTKPTATDVKELVVMLIGNADGSANTIFSRAFQDVSAYREKLNSDRKEYSKRFQENKAKAKKILISGQNTK